MSCDDWNSCCKASFTLLQLLRLLPEPSEDFSRFKTVEWTPTEVHGSTFWWFLRSLAVSKSFGGCPYWNWAKVSRKYILVAEGDGTDLSMAKKERRWTEGPKHKSNICQAHPTAPDAACKTGAAWSSACAVFGVSFNLLWSPLYARILAGCAQCQTIRLLPELRWDAKLKRLLHELNMRVGAASAASADAMAMSVLSHSKSFKLERPFLMFLTFQRVNLRSCQCGSPVVLFSDILAFARGHWIAPSTKDKQCFLPGGQTRGPLALCWWLRSCRNHKTQHRLMHSQTATWVESFRMFQRFHTDFTLTRTDSIYGTKALDMLRHQPLKINAFQRLNQLCKVHWHHMDNVTLFNNL